VPDCDLDNFITEFSFPESVYPEFTGATLFPIAFNSDNPGREIMGPMAAIIIGGLASSTLLNLLLLPAILLRYGKFTSRTETDR
jgi:Cu/Ag efflux pump CusA